jgi:N-methylhydantoinase A/oxoprolinase/acetone carboxylase beta subunit
MAFTLGIDIGGTFTDSVVMDETGAIATYKSPTTPPALVDGFLENVRLAAELEGLDARAFLERVERIAHGTTAATNAYLERRGAKVALITTRGFEDVVFAQRMMGMTASLTPSELTDYSRRRPPEPLAPPHLVFGVRERVHYRGEAIGPLREEGVHAAADRLAEEEVEAVAVAFLWSFKNPAHEQRAAEILAERLPGVYLSLSSRVAPRLGDYERTATTLVNAYLGPVVARGHDPRGFARYAFGGAGSTHAPSFALDLVEEIVVPVTQSVHSALGAIASDLAWSRGVSVPMRVSRRGESDEASPERLEESSPSLSGRRARRSSSRAPRRRRSSPSASSTCASRGRRKELRIPYPAALPPSLAPLVDDFLRTYARRYGKESLPETAGLELVTFAVDGRARLPRPALREHERAGEDPSAARVGTREVWDPPSRALVPTGVYDGERLRGGFRIDGPAVVEYAGTTVALTSGQVATVDGLLDLSIRRA